MDLLGIAGPKISLPTQVDPLYVEKPVGRYEPMYQDGEKILQRNEKESRQDGNKILKKVWSSKPKTAAEEHDIKQELTGEQLQKILTVPGQMNFGKVFVKSRELQGLHRH